MRGRLVVSCQPVDDGPLDVDNVVPLLAKAAQIGGAGAIRIEGANRVRLTRAAIDVPIIGIIKRDLSDSPVRITPYLADVETLADAGAYIIAVDATDRTRPATVSACSSASEFGATSCAAAGNARNLRVPTSMGQQNRYQHPDPFRNLRPRTLCPVR